jgi:hypothetical protein
MEEVECDTDIIMVGKKEYPGSSGKWIIRKEHA